MSMTLRERAYLIGKAFKGQFDLSNDSVGMQLLKGIYPSVGGDPPARTIKNHLDSYSTMPWLRTCASKVAYGVATAEWKLYVRQSKVDGKLKVVRDFKAQRKTGQKRRDHIKSLRNGGELREIEDHPLLDFLNEGNTMFKGFSVKKLTQVSLDLVGEAFLIKERNPLGAPVRSWPLPAHWVVDMPTPANRFYRVSFRSFQGDIPDTEVLHLRDPNPTHPYGRGSGIAQSLSDELETDEYASKHLKAFFYNRARPDFIVYPKADGMSSGLKREEVLRIEKDWTDKNQGFWRAFRPYFMTREVGIHQFDQNFQQMQLIELLKHERDVIIQVFGFPPELFGILESSNRATIEAAEMLFARWCVEPRLEFLRSELQACLVPEYDERLILDYESPVEEDKEFALKAMQAQPATVRVNEWRELQDLDPIDGPEGEMFLKPGTISVIDKLEPQEAVAEPTPAERPIQQPTLPAPNKELPDISLKALSDDDLATLYAIAEKMEDQR